MCCHSPANLLGTRSILSLTRLLAHSPTHSLTHSLTRSLTHSLTHSFTHPFTHPFTDSLTSLTHLPTSFLPLFIHSSIHTSIRSFDRSSESEGSWGKFGPFDQQTLRLSAEPVCCFREIEGGRLVVQVVRDLRSKQSRAEKAEAKTGKYVAPKVSFKELKQVFRNVSDQTIRIRLRDKCECVAVKVNLTIYCFCFL